MHPTILSGEHSKIRDAQLMEKIRAKLPDAVEYFTALIAESNLTVAQRGEFISNGENTPETPDWCPVILAKKSP